MSNYLAKYANHEGSPAIEAGLAPATDNHRRSPHACIHLNPLTHIAYASTTEPVTKVCEENNTRYCSFQPKLKTKVPVQNRAF